ncbi:MAG: substrate-binding domain-containing protein [Butyrivibrio sp.]|nr:substrate-binding domain-containing protein [Butyrivibrio sp.]
MRKSAGSLLGVALLMLFVITGCSGSVKEQETTENIVAEETSIDSYATKKIGICIYQSSDNFMTLFSQSLVEYLKSQGFSEDNIFVYGSSNNQSIQLTQVKELVEQNVDALIINPVNSSIVSEMTDIGVENGIPLVYINREPGAEEESRWEEYDFDVCYVGCDARQSGIYQGELLIDIGKDKLDRNGDGVIQYYMIEGAPENIDAGYRTKYSISTVDNAGIKMDCILDKVANWDKVTAKLVIQNGLKKNPAPEVIICNNDAMALGALEAVEEAGLVAGKDVYVVGVDALPEAIEKVIDGSLAGTVFNDFITQSRSAADAAIRYIGGDSNEHYIGCDYIKVTADNADTVKGWIENLQTDIQPN